jgi:PAS domain S-box-containing protein
VSVALESQKRQKIEIDLLEQQANLETIVKTRIESIESNAKLFRFLVARAPINILYMNRATEVIEINPEVELESGYPREFALGKTFYALFSNKKTRAQHLALFKKILSGEKIQGQELLMRRANGQIGEYSISASMEQDADGEPVIIAIAQDITQQKMVEQALQKARESAESADRIKSMFVASMSHELRTPLNSIIGFLGVVLHGMSGEINARQKDQLGRAYNSSKHLLALISDVIDISKIEAGFLQIHTEKFELLTLLVETQHAVHHITEEKKLILRIDCAKGITLNTDRKRLYQVILNVVSNAVKYTEHGSVIVSAILKDERLIIKVQDTGIGIDEEGLANLFKPFERVESRLRIKTLGTGLGLYLTQKILTQLLGGSIEVVSTPEVGSIFTINIPINAPEPSEDGVISVLESTKK